MQVSLILYMGKQYFYNKRLGASIMLKGSTGVKRRHSVVPDCLRVINNVAEEILDAQIWAGYSCCYRFERAKTLMSECENLRRYRSATILKGWGYLQTPNRLAIDTSAN